MSFSTLEICLTQRFQVLVLTCLLFSFVGDGKDKWHIEGELLGCSSSMTLFGPINFSSACSQVKCETQTWSILKTYSYPPALYWRRRRKKKKQHHGEKDTLMGINGRLLQGEKKWSWLPGDYGRLLQMLTKHPTCGTHWCITGQSPVLLVTPDLH